MAEMTIDGAVARIQSAPPHSPIAVFRGSKPNYLTCVFAHTVETRRAIKKNANDYIGTFDERINVAELVDVLRAFAWAKS